GTTHDLMLTGLQPTTRYFFALAVTDTAGNSRIDDNGGACYTFTTLEQPDYFTELFSASDNDLANQSITFSPDASSDFYRACRGTVAAFPTDPAGGTVLELGDDNAIAVTLTGGARVALYGTSYDSFYVGSNGYITFISGDATFLESLESHFSLPRIAAL